MNKYTAPLQKEEIKITQNGCSAIVVPIYPVLLDDNIKLDPALPHRVFPTVMDEWVKDLRNHVIKTPEFAKTISNTAKYWLNLNNTEENLATAYKTEPNGFATTLYLNHNGNILSSEPEMSPAVIHLDEVNMDLERLRDFSIDDHLRESSVSAYAYRSTNLSSIDMAILLRNWSTMYLNTALHQALRFKSKQKRKRF